MTWTQAAMLTRYQHVVDELRQEAAKRRSDALGAGVATGSGTTGQRRPSVMIGSYGL